MNGEDNNSQNWARWIRWIAIVCTVFVIFLWTAMAVPTPASWLKKVDAQIHDIMVELEWMPLVLSATFFSVLGGVWVTIPLRILIFVALGARRNWLGLSMWLFAVVPAQLVTSLTKFIYVRPRPEDRLLESVTASFPSGHASNAAAMSMALVFLFVPPGKTRRIWLAIAVGYSLVMAWSRVYLRVHWSSDVAAGLLLGTGCALWSVLLTQYTRSPVMVAD